MSLPVDIKSDRLALLKSSEYLDKSPRSQLKTLAYSAEFAEDVGFLFDGNRIPFSNDVNKKLRGSLEQWKMATSPNKPWDEFYRETRVSLKDRVELFRGWIKSENKSILRNSSNRKYKLVLLAQLIKTTKAAKKAGITFKKTSSGCGDAIKCIRNEQFVAVLKSVNGDPGSIDNPSSIHHPLPHNFAKPCRNYESAQKEAFAYDLAEALNLVRTIPPTILTLIESEDFHSFFDNKSVKEFVKECPEHESAVKLRLGESSRERLCSLQRAIPNSITLDEFEKKDKKINQNSFENVILITRILGETDGHKKNFLVKEIYGEYHLVKIDSGFSFPKRNAGALNSLIELDNAEENVSESYRRKTENINIDTLRKIAKKYKLHDDCIQAAVERIEFMKLSLKVISKITHRELELRLRMFSGYKLENEIRESLSLKKSVPISKKLRIDFALGVYTDKEMQNYERTILFGKKAIENNERTTSFHTEAFESDSSYQSDEEGYIFQFDDIL